MIEFPAKPKPIRLSRGLAHITPLRLKAKERSQGGLLLPPGVNDDSKQFQVLGLGPGPIRRRKGKAPVQLPVEVEVGDRVLVDTGIGGVELPDGTWIVRQSHIMLKW